jgi:hypothetical protein
MSAKFSWKTVDTQDHLEKLSAHFCEGHDCETLEFYAKPTHEKYFPADISRRGYDDKNLHVLLEMPAGDASHLELVFVGYEYVGNDFLDNICLDGRLDSLGRFEIGDKLNGTGLKCARLVYRWVDQAPIHPYFRTSDSIESQTE